MGHTMSKQTELSPHDFGAIGDGVALDTLALQTAIDTCGKGNGGQVTLRAGHTYLSGSLRLRPGVIIHLEAGSILLASDNYDDYAHHHLVGQVTKGVVAETVLPQRAFIVGYQAPGCGITGQGTLSGHGRGFIDSPGEHIHTMRAPRGGRFQYLERPYTVFLIDCDSAVFKDIHLDDPAFWAIRLTGCDNSVITGITLTSDMKIPNADGIDIDRCENVEISQCRITTADDCISIKSCAGTSIYGDTTNIRISDCVLETLSGAITIGTESAGLIANVTAQRCEVRNSHRGFAVRAREGGLIKNVVFRDSHLLTFAFSPVWWGHGEALHVTAFRWSEPEQLGEGNPERTLFGEIENVAFQNLTITTEAGALCWAQHRGLIRGVTFTNVKLSLVQHSPWPHRIDLRPNDVLPTVNRPHNAFDIFNSGGVTLSNVQVLWDQKSRDNYGEAIRSEESEVAISGLIVLPLA